MNKKTLHMIGNAHIDAVWLWQWQEGLREVMATFRSALDRLSEYPEFIFTASSAAYYAWVEENDPAMFAEIKRRVAEGRWCLVGGWWVEPDCNLPSGESLIRQGLLGQRYFQRAFGRRATVGYNIDSFGHSGMLPQILSQMGLSRYVFMRPGDGEKELPARCFWWESPDGSRVLTYRIPFTYTSWGKELTDHIGKCQDLLDEETPELMCFYGVGNHGGGPTKENIESILALDRSNDSVRIAMSRPDAFFDSVSRTGAELPVVRGELQYHARGCYSAHSGIKRLNRSAEIQLINAETFSILAELLASAKSREDLSQAWKNVLFCQFHDIIAGTSIEPAYEDARDQYGEALSISGRALSRSLQAIVASIGIDGDGEKPVVVFNPHSFDVRGPVELEFLHDGQVDDSALKPNDELVDDQGAPVPHQLIQSLATNRTRTRLCFSADVPALGHRVYRVRSRVSERPAPTAPELLSHGPTWAENALLRIELDVESGSLARLFDKRHGVEVLAAGGAGAIVLSDRSDTWSHGIEGYGEPMGLFSAGKVRLIEAGPVRVCLRAISEFRKSTLVQDFLLYRDEGWMDVRVRLDWREPRALLKLRFPVNVSSAAATYEIPFGIAVREGKGNEEPGQTWVDVTGISSGSGGGYGMGIANTAKYSYSFQDGAISLTVARSPIYSHHLPKLPEASMGYAYLDQGEQLFAYRLVPHAGDWRAAQVHRSAAILNNPLLPTLATFHAGDLPQRMRAIRLDEESISVTALKRAEDGDDVILRCRETHGAATEARIRFEPLDCDIATRFRPYEIKSFRISRAAPHRWREVNLLEE